MAVEELLGLGRRRRSGEFGADDSRAGGAQRIMQRAQVHRLYHPCVQAGGETGIPLRLQRVGRQADDRRIGAAGAQRAHQFIAVHQRHVHVRDQHVEFVSAPARQRLHAVRAQRDLAAQLLKLAHQQIPVDRIVLGHQHPQPQPPQTSVRPVFDPPWPSSPSASVAGSSADGRSRCASATASTMLCRRWLVTCISDRLHCGLSGPSGMHDTRGPFHSIGGSRSGSNSTRMPSRLAGTLLPWMGRALAPASASHAQVSCATSATGARTHTAGVGAISPPPARRAASAVTRSGSWKMNVLPRPDCCPA